MNIRRLALIATLGLLVSGGALALLNPVSGPLSTSLGESTSDGTGMAGEDRASMSAAPQLPMTADEGYADSRSKSMAGGSGELSSDVSYDNALGGLALPAPAGARVVKDASLSLEVGRDRLDATHRRALELVAGAGGFVQSSNLEGNLVGLVARVPAAELEGFLAGVGRLGKVVGESISGEDVSAEFVDLEARLRHWRAQETVFLGLMAKATTIGETIEVQRQLSSVQEQVEQLEGRRRLLEDRTSMSTVRITVAEPGVAVQSEPAVGLDAAWDRAWSAAVAVVGGVLVVTGALVPLVALALVALLLGRPLLRRRPAVVPPGLEGG
ncbi:MAG: DUF4349 domain-containing protein [Acidimicrobiia bacterium]